MLPSGMYRPRPRILVLAFMAALCAKHLRPAYESYLQELVTELLFGPPRTTA